MTKNDANEDLYFGMKRDTAKLEKWHNARHRTPRMGKKRKGLLENPAGHGRQPPPRRHPGGLRRLLPVVHLPARMHRHRRRARHGLPGQRNVPLHGAPRHKGGPAVVLQGGLRQGI